MIAMLSFATMIPSYAAERFMISEDGTTKLYTLSDTADTVIAEAIASIGGYSASAPAAEYLVTGDATPFSGWYENKTTRENAYYQDGNRYTGWYTLDASGDQMYFADGILFGGWVIDDANFYYLNPKTGLMAKNQTVGNFYVDETGKAVFDTTTEDGREYGYNGALIRKGKPSQELNEKVYIYRNILVEHPDCYAAFSGKDGNGYQFLKESDNGYTWFTYKALHLYERNADGTMGKLLYAGDGCFRSDAIIELKQTDGSIKYISPAAIINDGNGTFNAERIYIDPAGFISYVKA